MEVVLEEIPEETFEESVVEVVVILEDNDGNKYYVHENDEVQPLPEVDSNPGDEVGSSHFLHNTLYHVLLQTTLECTGKPYLLKAQRSAFNISDSTTIPLPVQNWQITSFVPDSTNKHSTDEQRTFSVPDSTKSSKKLACAL